MSKLKEIYEKDIEREIQGVIKVDDENFIKQELEEYVVTDELLKHFNSFFDSYNSGINGNTEKMGVWISGFFGSGKSHFLKIISYLLENKIVDGKHAVIMSANFNPYSLGDTPTSHIELGLCADLNQPFASELYRFCKNLIKKAH